jgi:hypothetical protein
MLGRVHPEPLYPSSESLAPPLFLLSSYRSGSTMLRLILDTHPDIWCPDELELGVLAVKLCHVIEGGLEVDDDVASYQLIDSARDIAIDARVVKRARAIVDSLMDGFTRERKKRRWCDKSPENVGYLPFLEQLYPDALWLCLYRHPLDTVASALNVSRYGFSSPLMLQHVRKEPSNHIEALARSWCDITGIILGCEARPSCRSFRVTYESLVTATDEVLAAMFAFIGADFDAAIVERAFHSHHHQRSVGGDRGTRFTTKVLQNRLGSGREPRRSREPTACSESSAIPSSTARSRSTRSGWMSPLATARPATAPAPPAVPAQSLCSWSKTSCAA